MTSYQGLLINTDKKEIKMPQKKGKKTNVDAFINRKLSVLNLKATKASQKAIDRIIAKNKGGLA